MTAVDIRLQFEHTIDLFKTIDVDCQLALLWQIYDTLGQAFAAIAPVALFSQAVQQLINQLDQVHRDDKIDVLRDILAGADTRFTQAYQSLNSNMRLAFWHRLMHRIPASALPSMAMCQAKSPTAEALITRLNTMGLNERLHFLRRVV
ncbi:MAG: hypothetical protein EA342_04035 [Leptolyngbya sp. LCM1.Bin17]|nr:MAG: hypothetical protein EA342_04035 [Leptolyngbya sp. LCM1.Bin17]